MLPARTHLSLARMSSSRFIKFVLTIVLIVISPFVVGKEPAQALGSSWPPVLPQQLILTVQETAGVARSGEVVRSGVPLPRTINILSAGNLTLVDSNGTPIPAEFEVLARWNAGKSDSTAPIQWLLITFQANVAANAS